MRSTSEPTRGTWATYVKAAREAAGLEKTELGQRIGRDRGTIHRWETGHTRAPNDADLVARFAAEVGVEVDEALAAAGLRPGADAPPEPRLVADEEIELVRSNHRLSPAMKVRIIRLIHERRERERASGIAETRSIIDALGDVG